MSENNWESIKSAVKSMCPQEETLRPGSSGPIKAVRPRLPYSPLVSKVLDTQLQIREFTYHILGLNVSTQIVGGFRPTMETLRLLSAKHCVAVLEYLERTKEPVLLKDIDYAVVRSHSSASRLMKMLRKQNWVERNRHKEYSLTEAGRLALQVTRSHPLRALENELRAQDPPS